MTGTEARKRARLAGALYLFIVVWGIFAEIFVRSAVIATGDPDATASRILAMESRYRVAAAGELLMWGFDVLVTVLLYQLLRPVGATLALVASLFRLVTIVALVQNTLNHFSALGFLTVPYMAELGESARAMALFSLRSHATGYTISLVYFGFHCLALGVLLGRSGYLPRWLGWLVLAAGAAYLVNSFGVLAAPTVSARLYPWVLLPPFVAESGLALWLLIRSVDARTWGERTAKAAIAV